MVSCIYLTGVVAKKIDNDSVYVAVTRPIMDAQKRRYLVDSFLVKVKNPPATNLQIMKVPEGTLVCVKGRLETDHEANAVLEANGLAGTCFVVIAEITECYTLSAGMAGYQQVVSGPTE